MVGVRGVGSQDKLGTSKLESGAETGTLGVGRGWVLCHWPPGPVPQCAEQGMTSPRS
jgi:hypothetical protein